MEFRTRIIKTREELLAITTEWESLLKNVECDTIFLTPEWINTWASVTSPKNLFFILVYKDEELVGIAPFYFARLKLFKLLNFTCLRIAADRNTTAEYQDLIIHKEYNPEVIHEFARVLKKHAGKFSMFWIPYTAERSGATGRFTRLFAELGYLVRARPMFYYTTELPPTAAEFELSLHTKQRNNIRRYKKKLSSAGDLVVKDIANDNQPLEAFNVLHELHNKRWQLKGLSGAFINQPELGKFFRSFSHIATKNKWLIALCLYSGDKAIAIRYGYLYKDRLYETQAGFEPDLNGAGIVNIDLAIKYSIKTKIATYDFLANDRGYKKRFGASPHPGSRLYATSNNLINRLILAMGIWPTGRFMMQMDLDASKPD